MKTPSEIKVFYDTLIVYHQAEELFGELDGDNIDEKLKFIHKQYRDLLFLYHADKYGTSDNLTKYYVSEICGMLGKFVNEAKEKIMSNTYGVKSAIEDETPFLTFEIDKIIYNIVRHEIETDFCNIYFGYYIDEKTNEKINVCFKIINDRKFSKYIDNEIKILKSIKHKHMPVYVQSFITKERQRAIITNYVPGYDLYTIKEKYVNGLDFYHVCWIMERLLSVLGFLHSNSIIHGNIEPGNIIVNPDNHNVTLIDYKFSLVKPTNKDVIQCQTVGFTANEIIEKKPPIPESDIFSLGKTMLFLLGGDIINNTFISDIDPRIKYFILQMIKQNPIERFGDAWKMWHQLGELRQKIFGEKQFLTFSM